MRAIVLGSAAGGGFPQWNCGCGNCAGLRAGTLRARARTQASLAVSSDGNEWLLLGASPDVRAQIAAHPPLAPRATRDSPIRSIALPNGDLDAWLGLLSLREGTPLVIFSTEIVARDLAANPILRTLERRAGHSRFVTMDPGARLPVAGLTIEAVPAPGKPPLHARRAPDLLDNVGFVVRDEQRSLAWFPSVRAFSREVARALAECDAIFFDGTFYTADELATRGIEGPPAGAMGHWPVSDSAAFLARLPARHKWLVHVNNTNPILVEDGAERARLRESGIEVAHDGLEWTA